jgi:hypothetical protein
MTDTVVAEPCPADTGDRREPRSGRVHRFVATATGATGAALALVVALDGFWGVPGSGHAAGLPTRPQEWEAQVTAFLDRHLGTS